MTGEFRSIDYSVNDVGKIMKSSKKRHMWVFIYKSKRFTLCVFESLKSGKFKIELNRKPVYETVGGKRSISKKVHDSRVGALTIELMKITNNQYRLTVNNNTFELKNANEQLFVYETFEQKQKKLQSKGEKNAGDEFFGIGKGGSKGLKGSDLFGDFKGKAQKSEKLKLKFGGKNAKTASKFQFDKGVFAKKGKFGENDFFGAKAATKKPAKKDPFADGGDIFGSKKTKKVTSDFDGFDLFGNQQKGGKGSVAKKKANFDDFGFGPKKGSNVRQTQKKDNWGDMDFFGNSKPKGQAKGRSGLQNRSAKDEIFGTPTPPKNTAADDDLLNFDIGVPGKPAPKPAPKPAKNEGFGDLDWDMPVKPKKSLKKVLFFTKLLLYLRTIDFLVVAL